MQLHTLPTRYISGFGEKWDKSVLVASLIKTSSNVCRWGSFAAFLLRCARSLAGGKLRRRFRAAAFLLAFSAAQLDDFEQVFVTETTGSSFQPVFWRLADFKSAANFFF